MSGDLGGPPEGRPSGDTRNVRRRLKDTHVFRWLGIYGTGAVMALTLVEFVREPWGLAATFVRTFHVLLGAGLFGTLLLAWFHGERGKQRVSAVEAAMLGLLVVLTGFAIARVQSGTDLGSGVVPGLTAKPSYLADPALFGIAVLPFEHLGPEEDRARTAAVHGEVLDALSGISAFTVLDRSTVLALDNPMAPAAEIASLLGIRYILTGRVQWAGRQLRLSVQLVDGPSGAQMDTWDIPARYDQPEEMFAIQSSIAGHVARLLQVEILPGEQTQLSVIPTGDALAMDAYLLGMSEHSVVGMDPEAMKRALVHMERAVDRDSTYGQAWARLAYLRQLARAQGMFLGVTQEAVSEAVIRAERHAPGSFETQFARAALTYWAERDWEQAERELVRLARRSPSVAEVHSLLGFLLRRTGDWGRALEELETSLTLDPLGYSTLVLASEASYMVGRIDRALELSDQANRLDPSLPNALWGQARIYLWGLGDTVSALQVIARSPHASVDGWMHFVFGMRGDPQGSLDWARRSGTAPDWQTAMMFRDAGFPDSVEHYGAAYRDRRLARLKECPPIEARTLCRQNAHSEVAVTLAIMGDTAGALAHLQAAEQAHDLFHDGYHSTSSMGLRALAYLKLGMWDEATNAWREILAAPSFFQPQGIRAMPEWAALLESHPPFRAMLDSMEVRRPLF